VLLHDVTLDVILGPHGSPPKSIVAKIGQLIK